MADVICTVCLEGSSKYKCPTCKSPSCSLACFKTHKAICSHASKDTVPSTTAAATVKVDSQPDRIANNIIDRAKLDALFLTYPNLRRQLYDIYMSTLDPVQRPLDKEHSLFIAPSDMNAGSNHTRNDRGWNPEKGFSRGLASIHLAIDAGPDKSEGLKQFLDLIAESGRAT